MQDTTEQGLTETSAPEISVSERAWKSFESAFPLGLPTVAGFLAAWLLFSQLVWAPRTSWPAWLQELPTIEGLPYLPAFAVAVLLLMVVVRVGKRAPLATLGLNFRELGQDIRWLARAIPVLVVGYALLGALAWLGVHAFAEQPDETIRQTLRAAFYRPDLARAFEVLVAAPILEEIWFRGMLYTPLRRERGRGTAILLTTLIFAFAHGPFPVTQLLGGLIFAWAYECRRTLVAPMVLHFCGNGTLVLGGIVEHHWNLLG